MIDITDMFLSVSTDIQRIVEKVHAQLREPQEQRQALQMWAQAPDIIKQAYADDMPEAYRQIEDALKKERR